MIILMKLFPQISIIQMSETQHLMQDTRKRFLTTVVFARIVTSEDTVLPCIS